MREIILDTETTGLDPFSGHKIIEIGCVEMINRICTGQTFHVYVNPQREVPEEAFNIHGISTEFLQDKQIFSQIANDFLDFIEDSPLVIHNAKFDMKFINYELTQINNNIAGKNKIIDTLHIARRVYPGSPASLDALCKRYKIDLSRREKHGALLDAELLADVYVNLTGGKQATMIFDNQDITNKDFRKRITNKILRQPRKFSFNEIEDREHDKIMDKIREPIWSK